MSIAIIYKLELLIKIILLTIGVLPFIGLFVLFITEYKSWLYLIIEKFKNHKKY